MSETVKLLLEDRQRELNSFRDSTSYNADAVREIAYISLALIGLKEFPLDGAASTVAKMETVKSESVSYADMAIDELRGAQEYWDLYQSTGDDRFRQMARQELSHSAALTEMGMQFAKTQHEKDELMDIKSKRVQMEKTIR